MRNDTGMPDYAIVNLLEIEDDVQGRVEGLEGRFGRKRLGSRDLGSRDALARELTLKLTVRVSA